MLILNKNSNDEEALLDLIEKEIHFLLQVVRLQKIGKLKTFVMKNLPFFSEKLYDLKSLCWIPNEQELNVRVENSANSLQAIQDLIDKGVIQMHFQLYLKTLWDHLFLTNVLTETNITWLPLFDFLKVRSLKKTAEPQSRYIYLKPSELDLPESQSDSFTKIFFGSVITALIISGYTIPNPFH